MSRKPDRLALVEDTIFALATPRGVSGVAVIRISGSIALSVLERLTQRPARTERELMYSPLIDPASGELIDRGLVVWFQGPHSFTGEDIAELHLHGSRAVLDKCSEVLLDLGCRSAEPGEFTRRAFSNGKYDLTQIEALSDLLVSETEEQRRQAQRQMDGGLADVYRVWRDRLVRVLAAVEAEVDFPDEDVPEGQWRAHLPEVEELRREVLDHLDDDRRGEVLRDGVEIALIGPPNVGKSSLLNALSQRDVAIVSDVPGTTRDVVEARLDLGGVPVILRDTAGLRKSDELVESEGVRRARQAGDRAQIRLWLKAPDTDWDATLSRMYSGNRGPLDLLIFNKIDLSEIERPSEGCVEIPSFEISAKTGSGLDALVLKLGEVVSQSYSLSVSPALTRARHRKLLEIFVQLLDELCRLETLDIALVAEHIRLSLRTLGEITGQVNVEEVLDLVFREFCIGK